MTSKQTRGIGLALVTVFWLALTGWAVLPEPGPTASPNPSARLRRVAGAGAAQQPAPARGLWDRLSYSARALWLGGKGNPAAEAVREAMVPLGVPDWHQAGFKGQGVKVAVLDSGFKGYRSALGKALPASVLTRSF